MVCTNYATHNVKYGKWSVPMGGDATDPRSHRTRAALLDATREILTDAGIDALTMAAVARRAGVSRRAVYLHFNSRADLLLALFRHVNDTEDLAGSLRAIDTAPDAVVALDAWAAHVAHFHSRLLPFAAAIERARGADADAAAHWAVVMADRLRVCRALVDRLARAGRLASPWTVETAADMLYALMAFDVLEALTVDRGWPVERFADHLATLLHAAFVAAEPEG